MSLTQIFQKKVPEIFSFVQEDYGFEFEIVSDYLINAKKGDVLLDLRFDRGVLFSLGIEVTGNLAEFASPDPRYRKIGATVIAKCLDKEYKSNIKKIKNEEDLINQIMDRAWVLEKYCGNILAGDVSEWKYIIDCLRKK